MTFPSTHQIELFNSLFRGRTDLYARRWEKEGRSGYSPAYEFNWDAFMAHKRRGGSLKDFENKRLLPLTNEVIKIHLLGVQIVGIYPILPDNTSWFLAADFDGDSWKQEAFASTFREVVAQLNPQYLYGLTATPKRKHNDEKLIYIYIGDIIALTDTVDVKPALPQPVHQWEIIVRETNLSIPFKFTTDLFQLLAKVICFDTARNQLIVEDILRESGTGKKVLVLSERKEHLEILELYLKGKREIIAISEDDSARSRKSKMKQIEDGHFQVVLSTGQYFGEGIDTQGFTCLIFAFPFSFEGKLIQYIGRLRDIGAQKIIIDYRDKNIPFLERQFKHRERYYKKIVRIN